MATVAMASVPPADDARLQRMGVENALRLWTLGVRLATRELLALGRPYEVQYHAHAHARAVVADVAYLGFELLTLLGTHVLQVKDVASRARLPVTVSPQTAVQPRDFLVGINGDDLLLAPPRGLSQARKRIVTACNAALAAQPRDGEVVLTLKFVRLEHEVEVDATRQLTHCQVLEVLDRLERTQRSLLTRYDELLLYNHRAVAQRLMRHKRLLDHGIHKTATLRDAAVQNERFQLASRFQTWYTDMMAALSIADTDSEEATSGAHAEPTDVDMDFGDAVTNSDSAECSDEKSDEPLPAKARAHGSTDRDAPAPSSSTALPAAPKKSLRERLQDFGAESVDLEWRDVLPAYQMKWLPRARDVLTSFIEGLVDGFISDGFWITEMASRSRSIVERLVMNYTRKLATSKSDNASIRKEFVKHARMLRSNIGNPGNNKLRSEILTGAVSVAALCEMTSEHLAPEALQAERQRRYEQHAKEITITEAAGGSRLVKTKHGIKEIESATSIEEVFNDSAAIQPPSSASTNVISVVEPAVEATGSDASAAAMTEQVTNQLRAMEFENGPEPPPNAATSQERSAPTPSVHRERTQQRRSDTRYSQPPSVKNVKVTVEDCQAMLRVMFDPAQDLIEQVSQLHVAIHSVQSLATMSFEFNVAPGVTLYRDLETMQYRPGAFQFRARVRLLHWMFTHVSTNDRDATMNALIRVIDALKECQRLFGTLLDGLCEQFNFPQPRHNHVAYRHAINMLVQNGAKIKCYSNIHRGSADGYRAVAVIDSLELSESYDSAEHVARAEAAHNLVAFLSDIVALRLSMPPAPPVPIVVDEPDHEKYHRDQYPSARPSFDDKGYDYDDGGTVDAYERFERKRPYDDIHQSKDIVDVPPPVRQKTDDTRGIDYPDRQPQPQSQPPGPAPLETPAFFVDAKGEAPRTEVDHLAAQRQTTGQVEAYQHVVKEIMRSYADIAKMVDNMDWDPSTPERTFNFPTRLTITRKISRAPNGDFVCEITGYEGNVRISYQHQRLDVAVHGVKTLLRRWFTRIKEDWSNLASVYTSIMERKKKQKGNEADSSLSAGNETRKDRSVSSFVKEYEKKLGHQYEYTIDVRSHVAIRCLSLNMKNSKRAAGEAFRNMMEFITKLQPVSDPKSVPPSSSTAKPSPSTASRAPVPPAAPRPPPTNVPNRRSNMVVCSDDSDSDDDDDGYGGYSDDEDSQPSAIGAHVESQPKKMKGNNDLVSTVLREAYPITSEQGPGDDARMRALIRSLFTGDDNLWSNISRIRGALKYQPRAETVIVPNVKAEIRVEVLRSGTVDAYASVNGVVTFKATARSKQEACDKVVDGLLRELDELRLTWAQLLHFFHEKEMWNHNAIGSFDALRLANIVKIESIVESPPNSHHYYRSQGSVVHSVMLVGGKVLYRVDEEDEADAHRAASARTARFIVDLIDKGLDPRPPNGTDRDFQPMQQVDWRCIVQLQDFGDSNKRTEFHVDARWAIRSRVPSSSELLQLPPRITLAQVGRIQIQEFERSFGSSDNPTLFYFELEALYENGKFFNHIAEYGHKNKFRTFVLKFDIVETSDIVIYVLPPGGTVNGTNELYMSHKVLPRELASRKTIYGYATRRDQSSSR